MNKESKIKLLSKLIKDCNKDMARAKEQGAEEIYFWLEGKRDTWEQLLEWVEEEDF